MGTKFCTSFGTNKYQIMCIVKIIVVPDFIFFHFFTACFLHFILIFTFIVFIEDSC